MLCNQKMTVGRVVVFAGTALVTGLMFAAGYDLYRWIKSKATGGSTAPASLGAYIPEPKVVTFDNTVTRRF
jgi:hypothetical protein